MLHTIRTWIAHHAPGRWRTLYLSDAKAFITNLEIEGYIAYADEALALAEHDMAAQYETLPD